MESCEKGMVMDMWKEYSFAYIKRNRASGISVMAAALIAALLLSVLCSFFYNIWRYDVESVILEEGDWQGRIVGNFSAEDLELLSNFANVDRVAVQQEVPVAEDLESKTVDIYFHNPRRIYHDMTLVSEKFGLRKDQVAYHYSLLAMYFIRIPGDDAPRLVMPFYFAVLMMVCISLILVIHNSFAVSMNARIRQLGILSGIGATPRQIRTCLLQEAAALCTLPVVAGSLIGIAIGYGMIRMMSILAVQLAGRHEVVFQYHPAIFLITVLASALTVCISVWIPARKLARLTPLEAIRGVDEIGLKRRKHSPVLSLVFGIEGELAGNALKAQKKALRTSTISLTFSFLGFTMALCFFRLSQISTGYTYFARYQDVWDVMAILKDVKIEDLGFIAALQEAEEEQGAASCVVYQKARAVVQIPEAQISDELNALGGPEAVAGESGVVKRMTAKEKTDCIYLIQAPIVILDDMGFLEYCEQAGVAPGLDGTIILNTIWDSVNSNFRYPEYIPYLKESKDSIIWQNEIYDESVINISLRHEGVNAEGISIPVLGYTDEEPDLREEYEDYALVQVIPLSLWKKTAGRVTDVESDAYIRVLADRTAELTADISDEKETAIEQSTSKEIGAASARISTDEAACLEKVIMKMVGQKYEAEIENRIQEKITNDRLILGYEVVIGIFCGLLAVIGIANIFSYTMGFLRQRRREFARYLSVGMTPAGIKKMFYIEIMVIAGRPVLITLSLAALFVEFMARASYLDSREFWTQAPYIPLAVFMAGIFGFVGFAYHLGGQKILQDNLADALRDDMMV